MTDAQTALSRRLVACKGWRWMPGMLVCVPGDRGHITAVFDGDEGVTVFVCFDEETPSCRFEEEIGLLLPDLIDPATVGCLLALVREAWSDPYLCVVGDPDTGWRIDAVTAQVQDLHGYASEAEALVSALERSP